MRKSLSWSAVLTYLFFFTALSGESIAASSCDLSPVSLEFNKDIPMGSEVVKTIIVAKTTFSPTKDGSYTLKREILTLLSDAKPKILAQISALDQRLPKNDCNAYARVSSASANVVGKTFSISAKVNASMWACSPGVKIPCLKSSLETDPFDEKATYTDLTFGSSPYYGNLIFVDFWSKHNPFKPKGVVPEKLPDLRLPEVKMCEGPRIKTKLGDGSVTIQATFTGTVINNNATINVNRSKKVNLGDRTKFLLATLTGPAMASVLTGTVESQIGKIIENQNGLIPNSVKLPESPGDIIEWKTRSAIFQSVNRSSKMIPAFVVRQEYIGARKSLACLYRKELIASK